MLSAYLDSQISPAERARVEGHLATCAACRSELDGLRGTVALLRALPRVPVPRAFTLSEAQVGIRRPEPRPAWGAVLRGLGAVTAIALVAVVAGSLLKRPSWQPAATVARVAPMAATVQPAIQPTVAAESAPAAAVALAPAPTEPNMAAEKAVEQPAATTDTTAPTTTAQMTAVPPPAPAAPLEEPVVAEPAAAPPAVAAAKVAATGEPGMMAEVAVAPQGTPAVGVMAFGRGSEGAGAPEILTQMLPPEPTPALARPESVLPATAGFVYSDENGLWTVDGESGVQQVATGEGLSLPIISYDRSRVAYRVARDAYSELWAVRWDGTDAGLLLNERELPVSDLPAGYTERRFNDVRWLPGRDILAVTTVAIPGSADLLPRLELWHLDESGALQRVADMGRATRPFYSPDGKQFVLLQYGTSADPRGSLTLINADGTDSRVALRFPAGPDTPSSDAQIAWLPDGSGLWVYIPDLAPGSESGNNPTAGGARNGVTLYRVSASGSDAQAAGRADGAQVFWSPDGSQLAYTRAGDDDTSDLFLAKADGTNPQFYAALGNGGFINWAPDGKRFLYFDGDGQTYAGAPDETPQLLGRSMSLFFPRWISARQLLALHDTGTNWLLVERTLDAADGRTSGIHPLPREVTYDVTRP